MWQQSKSKSQMVPSLEIHSAWESVVVDFQWWGIASLVAARKWQMTSFLSIKMEPRIKESRAILGKKCIGVVITLQKMATFFIHNSWMGIVWPNMGHSPFRGVTSPTDIGIEGEYMLEEDWALILPSNGFERQSNAIYWDFYKHFQAGHTLVDIWTNVHTNHHILYLSTVPDLPRQSFFQSIVKRSNTSAAQSVCR